MFACYWARMLKADGIPRNSVVGLWLGGMTYTDVLHIYGMSRAGYIPQLFSLRLPSPTVIFELLHKANAKALVYDASFASILSESPISTYLALSVDDVHAKDEHLALPEMPTFERGDQIVFILHTSGSTSGSPKLVPCSATWLNTIVNKMRQLSPLRSQEQDVCVSMGSMCHVGQESMLLGSLQHGSCTILPTQLAFSTDELMEMIIGCRMNRLNQFGSFLSTNIRAARQNPKLLNLLQSLDEIIYSGLALPQDDEAWAYSQGLPLKNLFGNTECSAMFFSVGGQARSAALLRPVEGVSYGFFPIEPSTSSESAHQSTGRMLELVVLAGSGDCPHSSLLHADGNFHTGDLFQEVSPGCYVSRGRDDDWIKSENALRCDTRSIEDNVRQTCGHLVTECVVVGNGRPSPTLFVEPAVDTDCNKLKKEIIRKTRLFHSRRYLHERITSPDFIVVVPPKSLPRTATKGNIRRKAVEQAYQTELDRIYGVI
jgi:acyl-coenzyme A synthetase/AMP-(fatty) acid ligase